MNKDHFLAKTPTDDLIRLLRLKYRYNWEVIGVLLYMIHKDGLEIKGSSLAHYAQELGMSESTFRRIRKTLENNHLILYEHSDGELAKIHVNYQCVFNQYNFAINYGKDPEGNLYPAS